MNFSEKVILITGSASGIGEDVAIEFAQLNAKIVLVDISEERLKIVADKIIKNKSPSIPLQIVADVIKDAANIINRTINHFGRLDILINSAGICQKDTPTTMDLKTYDHIFAINCRAIVELIKFAVPFLQLTKGNIINISSFCGLKANLNLTSYCMSKAALNMYTKCASLELASKGIRVNAINPGTIQTPIFQTQGICEEDVQQILNKTKERYPVGRTGTVSDTTNAILFLASDQANFINGVNLSIDGGRLIY